MTKVLLTQFGLTARSRQFHICFNLSMMETTALFKTFNTRNGFMPFPRHNNSISEIYRQFFGLDKFLLWHLRLTVGPYIDMFGHTFRKKHTAELATGELQSSCRDSARMIKVNWMHQTYILGGIAKGWECLCKWDISVIHFQYISKNMFSLCHYGV